MEVFKLLRDHKILTAFLMGAGYQVSVYMLSIGNRKL